MLGLLVISLVAIISSEGRIQAIRVKLTGNAPELTLGQGQQYHLFNSHIWSTGQDAVATIKRQLQRLMLNVRVFLDVDDLENIGTALPLPYLYPTSTLTLPYLYPTSTLPLPYLYPTCRRS